LANNNNIFLKNQFGKNNIFNFFSPFLDVGHSKFFGVEFWLTTILNFFKKINLAKKTYLNFFLPFQKLVTPNFVGVEFW
jgi:hypothetical protein